MAKVNGYEIICPVCKGIDFDKKNSIFNYRWNMLFGLNQRAKIYICETCGYIYWFMDDGREYTENFEDEEKFNVQPAANLVIDYETSKAEPDECPVCFTKHALEQKECLNCGYSFSR